MNKLKAIKDLLSQKYKKAASFEEALEAMADLYLEKKDPIQKAKRSQIERQKRNTGPSSRLDTKQDNDQDSRHNTKQDQHGIKQEIQQQPMTAKVLTKDHRSNQNSNQGSAQNSNHGSEQERNHQRNHHSNQSSHPRNAPSSSQRRSPVARHVRNHHRQSFTAETKHEVMLSCLGQCTAQDHNNTRCTEKRWLQIHHIKPVAQGGDNSLSNLTLLCWGHHKMEHLI